MDAENGQGGERVSIMTLHAAKGLEFDIVFLPGWEEGLFPHQRSLEENGRAGLEEERRLAYVGLTRARRQAHIYFAANRRVRGLWQTSLPSRFLTELPEDHIDIRANSGPSSYRHDGVSRFASGGGFGSRYDTPGWRRAQEHSLKRDERANPRAPLGQGRTIQGHASREAGDGPSFEKGDRVFHMKFGEGAVVSADGAKLTVDFDRAGRKLVMGSFVTPMG
jgi:DNA helicase-2/ATP-dependent DNA helicase PcrA